MRMHSVAALGFVVASLLGCEKLDAAKQAAEAAKQAADKAAQECAACPKCEKCDKCDNCVPLAPPLEPPGAYPGFTWKRCGGTQGTCTSGEFTDAGYKLSCATPNTTCYPDNMCRAVWASVNKCHPGATMTCKKSNGNAGTHTCTNVCEWTTCS